MSERVRESLLSSLFASKRFVVAACAAVAMVLGAMSAGASMSVSGTPAAATSSPYYTGSSLSQASTLARSPTLTQQHPLGSSRIVVATPQYTVTTAKAQRSPLTDSRSTTITNVSVFQDKTAVIEQLQTKPSTNDTTTAQPATEPTTTTPTSTQPPEETTKPAEEEPASSEEPTTSPTEEPASSPSAQQSSTFSTNSTETTATQE